MRIMTIKLLNNEDYNYKSFYDLTDEIDKNS